jgi:TetR/AcrR family transcriptional repressor of nem operon
VKVTKEKSAEHHEAIIAAGAKLYRERGFDGVGVVEIMKAAGLTHGAFYGHFASKDALCAASVKRAFDDRRVALNSAHDLSAYIDAYMSVTHRDKVGTGCPVATFASQIGRQARPVQKQFTQGVSSFLEWIASHLAGGATKPQNTRTAAAILSAMVGSVLLARSTSSDKPFSDQILTDSRAAIAAKFGV